MKFVILAVLLVIAVVAVRRYFHRRMLAAQARRGVVPPGRPDEQSARRARALERIDQVNAEYGAKASDIVYVIENNALFNTGHAPSYQLAVVQQRAQDADRDGLAIDQLEALAAELRVAFDAAVAHAEQLGLTALGDQREQGVRAAKLARKAASTRSEHEQQALLAQCRALLETIVGMRMPAGARGVIEGQRRSELGG